MTGGDRFNCYLESKMRLNGVLLSAAQSMTVRVALESFERGLTEVGLGDDAHGKAMTALYLDLISEIRRLMYGDQTGGGT